MTKVILNELSSETLPDMNRIDPVLRVKQMNAGDCLFMADVRNPYVYFVSQGIIKMVYESADGKAWIKAFAEEGRFFTSMTSLAPGGKTSFAAYAACEARVEQVPYQTLLDLADEHPAWQKTLRKAFEIYGYRKETRERELLIHSAEDRYINFIKDWAGMAERLTDKDIAAYVRITPVALSRIKRRLLQEG